MLDLKNQLTYLTEWLETTGSLSASIVDYNFVVLIGSLLRSPTLGVELSFNHYPIDPEAYLLTKQIQPLTVRRKGETSKFFREGNLIFCYVKPGRTEDGEVWYV